MRSFTVSIRIPDRALHPMHRLIDDHQAVNRSEMFEWNVTSEDRIGLVFRVLADREVYETALTEVASIDDYELVELRSGELYLSVWDAPSEGDRKLYEAFMQTNLVAVPPISFLSGRRLTVQVLGTAVDVETVVDEFPDDFDVELEAVTAIRPTGGRVGLTDRQRETLATAERVGYYEIPREGTVSDVGDELGVSSSTAGNHLRKAEARLARSYLDGRLSLRGRP
ncbi:helix-turn-helix domain-containing protein [Halostagnicola sp. A-GB9-2]|uniref:helix-turn-helix domain-containing protein n=1 Tax=Halostagnicola sp. A-GB9-2 TaxID=3048066 RepID=UPI0024BF9758|nr:helix-turn-helix domain-containing protein [Halostagnicola sp. A-GB9-2]MDJ1431342.1 helix-turn-helix domain-containing protein [Halostagnicola sp. A-GB9-2]